ncbi:hypothetical protein AURDEDRAFT_175947 [Auricularia subglabra TFB-10046 SS5]|nr:hypothetical protein AURDEDRAFT_175947 [Auricularia subglabra TFB-10046 SS5]
MSDILEEFRDPMYDVVHLDMFDIASGEATTGSQPTSAPQHANTLASSNTTLPSPGAGTSQNASLYSPAAPSISTAPATGTQPVPSPSTHTGLPATTSLALNQVHFVDDDTSDADAGEDGWSIAPFDTLATGPDPSWGATTDPSLVQTTAQQPLSNAPAGRKRKLSVLSSTTDVDDEEENIAPGADTTVSSAKRRRRAGSPTDATNAVNPYESSPGESPQTVATAGASNTGGPTLIAAPSGEKYGCISLASFQWLSDGSAQCLYHGPCRRMQNKNHKPLKLNGSLEPDRLYKHWKSHERAEAMAIAKGKTTFDKALLVKNAADQAAVFDKWPRCPTCKCKECARAGRMCTMMHHGKRFARKERLDAHLAEDVCNKPKKAKGKQAQRGQ